MSEFEAMYRAVESRDIRWDGRVFVAVTSTGIFCRPICPVPMPRREHVRFYRNAAAAEQAGFRACRRCRPEQSPDSPDWDIRADLVGRALRLIAGGVADEEGIDGLASRLAVSTRHLHRLFVGELGASPREVAASRRSGLAKQLLDETDLSSAEVAFAAGFGSLRAYNAAMRRSFGRTPSEIRAHRRPPDAIEPGIRLRLAFRPPLAAGELLRFVADRAIPGVEHVEGSVYRRAIETATGPAMLRLRVAPPSEGPFVELRASAIGAGELAGVVRGARRLLDLDAETDTIEATLAADRCLRPLVESTPGFRLAGAFDGWETTVVAVLGQGIALRTARTIAGRIAAAIGSPVDVGDREVTRLFPRPAALAAADLDGLGIAAQRRETLHTLATRVADGRLSLDASADPVEVLAGLRTIPGIGPWTAGYVALRVLRDPDAFPDGDAATRAAFRRLGLPDDPSAIERRAQAWRPWRGYAVARLWSMA